MLKRKTIDLNIEKEFLANASKNTESLKKTLNLIKDGSLFFVGQYSDKRKRRAIAFLTQALKEKNESTIHNKAVSDRPARTSTTKRVS